MKKKRTSFNILITAGPTREFIDPVRYISNLSTGTIGYLLAKQAQLQGHKVVLLSGSTHSMKLPGIKIVYFNTALDLKKQVSKFYSWADVIICAAAVSDFRPLYTYKNKIKKKSGFSRLQLIPNPDILKELGKKKKDKILIGFALETENLIKNAIAKLKQKNLDLVVANLLSKRNSPFGAGSVCAGIISSGQIDRFSRISKHKLARIILDRAEKLCYSFNIQKKRRDS